MTLDDHERSDEGVRSLSTDARAVRTRQRLVAAYLDLLSESDSGPAAARIARAAGLNRSSFYAHFRNVGELSLYVLDAALNVIHELESVPASAARSENEEARQVGADAVLRAVALNSAALGAVVRNDRALAREGIGRAIENSMTNFTSNIPALQTADRLPLSMLIKYVSFGWAGVICSWLAGELNLTQSELTEQLLLMNPDPTRFQTAER